MNHFNNWGTDGTFFVAKSELIACESLCELISKWGFRVVGKTNTLEETIGMVRAKKPKFVLIESSMCGKNCVSTINSIKEELPRTSVIVLATISDIFHVSEIVLSESNGFLNYDDGINELQTCILNTYRGEKYYSDKFRNLMNRYGIMNVSDETKKLLQRLSKREKEILKMMSIGLTSDEIVEKLSISYWTFIAHKSNIVSKLELESARCLPKFAIATKNFI